MEKISDKEQQEINSMIEGLCENQQKYIKDGKYLKTSTIPEDDWYYKRDGVKEVLKHMHDFLVNGGNKMVYIHGGNGVGKTATVNFLINTFKEQCGKQKLYPEEFSFYDINCKRKNSSYAIIKSILDVKTRKAYNDVLAIMESKFLVDINPIIILLDDLQELKDDDVLYTLSRLNKNILLIATSKYDLVKIASKFSSDTRSSLNARTEFFNNYDNKSLYNILLSRASKGLYKYNEYMLRKMAKLATNFNRGDARLAIKILEIISSEDQYLSWLDKFEQNKSLLVKQEDVGLTQEENASLLNNLMIEFENYLSKVVDKVVSSDQITFINGLNNQELYALNMIITDSAKGIPSYASRLIENPKAARIGLSMSKFTTANFIDKLRALDIVSVSKVYVNKSYQNEISHKLTTDAIMHIESIVEDLLDTVNNESVIITPKVL